MKNLTRFSKLLCAVLLAGLVAGCGGSSDSGDKSDDADTGDSTAMNITENLMEAAIKASSGEEADVNLSTSGDETKFSIKSDGQTMEIGAGAKIPEDWPADAPLYPDLNVQVATSANNQFTVMGTTSDSFEKVAEHFAAKCGDEGWTEDAVVDMSGEQTQKIQTYKKDDRQMHLVIASSADETSVSVSVTSQ
ncbi:MAG: hypothetical protein KJ052_22075 [Candidatus Hydrogenedentes bacterium]|nr:hypothetical protein [Candidatus Hydrogenedentota bacterium]